MREAHLQLIKEHQITLSHNSDLHNNSIQSLSLELAQLKEQLTAKEHAYIQVSQELYTQQQSYKQHILDSERELQNRLASADEKCQLQIQSVTDTLNYTHVQELNTLKSEFYSSEIERLKTIDALEGEAKGLRGQLVEYSGKSSSQIEQLRAGRAKLEREHEAAMRTATEAHSRQLEQYSGESSSQIEQLRADHVKLELNTVSHQLLDLATALTTVLL